MTWEVPFCHSLIFKKFLSPPNHSITVCVKGERINREAGFGLKIPDEYIFYENMKAIQWTKRTLAGVDGNVKGKVLRCLK